MNVSPEQVKKSLTRLLRIGAPLPPGLEKFSYAKIASYCNGIGSDDPATKWLVAPTTFVFNWMFDASVPHDMWWSPEYNDGTRKRFELSNQYWHETLDFMAEDSLGWVWPKPLRQDLRNGRKWEADKSYKILMSDKCWEIWQKNAEIEPGPECMEVLK